MTILSRSDVLVALPFALPTLNEYIQAERGNRYAAAAMKAEWTNMVAAEVYGSQNQITSPVHVHCTWTRSNQRSDPDNVAFAIKFVLDGLVQGGMLPNDSAKYIKSIHHEFEVGEPRVDVRLIPLAV